VKTLSITNVAAAFAALGMPNSGASFKDEMNSFPNDPISPADKRHLHGDWSFPSRPLRMNGATLC
jgi:hypothetical protein